ncbi:hypothetical protein TRFO_21033 [Tritrichomonas foetus]|uniref:Uncharacterized protein n=1 Tax=Tritrichomonas foetus TaxID=1144522 RepID=A0A1J4KJR7_9EUKA|nr:hypothetical protein TRFO_21033 [Tritrichomonas foetus]|eukprot:OHT09942.1 hypothetical protein TRFO_21033 [Tritrichomonas foetus]
MSQKSQEQGDSSHSYDEDLLAVDNENNNQHSESNDKVNECDKEYDKALSQKVTDFIARQFQANERMQKIRDHPEAERRFNPPPEKFVLQSAYSPERKTVVDNEHLRTQELFEKSIKKKKEEEKPMKIQSNMSDRSKQLANARNERQINVIFTGLGKINQTQFDGLMRRFSIKSPELISELEEYSQIDDSSYSGSKLKKLMILAANRDYEIKLAKKVQPFVTTTLANTTNTLAPKIRMQTNQSIRKTENNSFRPSNKSTQSSKNNKSEVKNSRSEVKKEKSSTKRKISFNDEDNDESDDGIIKAADIEKTKKVVSPNRKPVKGSKYLPGFYESVQFRENDPTPRYSSTRSYVSNNPRTPWK